MTSSTYVNIGTIQWTNYWFIFSYWPVTFFENSTKYNQDTDTKADSLRLILSSGSYQMILKLDKNIDDELFLIRYDLNESRTSRAGITNTEYLRKCFNHWQLGVKFVSIF